jgi:hypothetical protein
LLGRKDKAKEKSISSNDIFFFSHQVLASLLLKSRYKKTFLELEDFEEEEDIFLYLLPIFLFL